MAEFVRSAIDGGFATRVNWQPRSTSTVARSAAARSMLV